MVNLFGCLVSGHSQWCLGVNPALHSWIIPGVLEDPYEMLEIEVGQQPTCWTIIPAPRWFWFVIGGQLDPKQNQERMTKKERGTVWVLGGVI